MRDASNSAALPWRIVARSLRRSVARLRSSAKDLDRSRRTASARAPGQPGDPGDPGRKRGLAAVLGFQSIAQLRRIYGHEQATVLASMPSTKLILRVDNEPETAAFLARQIGERESPARRNRHERGARPTIGSTSIPHAPHRSGGDGRRDPALAEAARLTSASPDSTAPESESSPARRKDASASSSRGLSAPARHHSARCRFGCTSGDRSERKISLTGIASGSPGEDSRLMLVMSKGALSAAQAKTHYEEKWSHDDYYC